MNKLGLIIGEILVVIGLFFIDRFLFPTLDYFGKYVFFIAFNLFCIFLPLFFYKKFNGILKIAMPIIIGIAILLLGIKFF
ncbi:hypothetical protein FE773_08210 [Caminibacter mediatlanticus TB-2]|uniref:Uncharacterized protein n=1 Tax=Caminibacter mediatlanticus TB-2 TaxID=391592 RepID=A0AAI9F381_9BACT|nr:hypothetical protein [Caminibacter mediatlanticus]EDM24530.1 hypothetical protein CMTB2_03403 [Caminibacter mediatlanticus TB-2]QCT95175.1 hypothetical protein FE773_08210 [Caminibacter mediatlanticus TB-2]